MILNKIFTISKTGQFCKCVLILFLLLTIVSAETIRTEKNKSKSYLSALEFKLNSSLNLGSFQGGTIAYKRRLKNNKALRLGFTLNKYYHSDYLNETDYADNDASTISKNIVRYEYNRFNLSLYSQLLHIETRKHYCTYYGIGIVTGVNVYCHDIVSDDRYSLPLIGTRLPTNSDIYNSYYIGILLSAGFEWFVYQNISLTAEYNTRIQYGNYFDGEHYMQLRKYSRSARPILRNYSITTKASGYFYSVNPSVNLGLSIYFHRNK